MRVRRCLVGLVWILVLVSRPAPALAQGIGGDTVVRGWDDTQAQKLFGQLMSPFCRGLTLAQCPSPGADSLRQDIRARLARGESSQAITSAYAADWGEHMLGAPPVRDWGVLLWTLPGVLLLVGAGALSAWLLRLRRRSVEAETAPEPGGVPVEPALRKRLEEELEAFEKNA